MKYTLILFLLLASCNKDTTSTDTSDDYIESSTDPTERTPEPVRSTTGSRTETRTELPPVENPAPQIDDDNVYVDPDEGTSTELPGFTQQFMKLVNDHRRSIGLKDLINDEGISEIAQGHSDDMAAGRVAFGHTGFSSRCSASREALGGGNYCGENVAVGQKTPQAVFTSWMNSSGHRANIEQKRYTHSGFGFKANNKGSIYWTHIFLEQN